MIGTNAFNYINVLDKAADASMLRHEVISNNIANNDTANYKRRDVKFEEYLKKELSSGDNLDKQVSNVNIETENANLAENQIRYYTLLDSMSQEFSRIKSVLQR